MQLREDGRLIHDGIMVGEIQIPPNAPNEVDVTLNLAWCRAAGVHVRVLGDPSVEKRRVVLDR